MLAVLLVLGTGIAANVVVFDVLSGMLLRPLPYSKPDRVVTLNGLGSQTYCCLSYGNIQRLQEMSNHSLRIDMLVRSSVSLLSTGAGAFQVNHRTITSGLFGTLGVHPVIGTDFSDNANVPGNTHVAIISNNLWRRAFSSDPHVAGMSVRLSGTNYTIIGVMPRGFECPFGEDMQLWSPEPLSIANRIALSGENRTWGDTLARLPDGMSLRSFEAMLSDAQAAIRTQSHDPDLPDGITVKGYQDELTRSVHRPLLLLYGVVCGLWALAAINASAVVLARQMQRDREIAVKSALGCTVGRLAQSTIIEAGVYATVASAMGVGISVALTSWTDLHFNQWLPYAVPARLDWRAFALVIFFTLIDAVAIGVVPVFRSAKLSTASILHGFPSTLGRLQRRMRQIMVAAQFALTLMFLVGAQLFLTTIYSLWGIPLGFSQQNVLFGSLQSDIGHTTIELHGSPESDVIRARYLPLLERVRTIPGVVDAALSSSLPLGGESNALITLTIDHATMNRGASAPEAAVRVVSPSLAKVLGIPVLNGRFFDASDTLKSARVAVVNKAFAINYLSGSSPVGHVISTGTSSTGDSQIVGVVGDMKETSLTDTSAPELYLCLCQTSPGGPMYGVARDYMQIAILGSVPVDGLRIPFQRAVQQSSSGLLVGGISSVSDAVTRLIGSRLPIAEMLTALAGIALSVALVGLYGLLSISVAQRSREIGIRMAVGATRGKIAATVVVNAISLAAVGAFLGAVISWFAFRLIEGYVYGTSVHSLFVLFTVTVVLATTSVLAALLPALRAASMDPTRALRAE
jgi:predicted permease